MTLIKQYAVRVKVLPMLLLTLLLLDVSSLSFVNAAASNGYVNTGTANANADMASLLHLSKSHHRVLTICNGGSINLEGSPATAEGAFKGNDTTSFEYVVGSNETIVLDGCPTTTSSSSSRNNEEASAVALEELELKREDQQQLQHQKNAQAAVIEQQPEGQHVQATKQKKLKVLFLSADTGGGHRASAESLANQFLKHYPDTEYELVDVWTPTNVYPYTTLVKAYKHLSAHPHQWRMLYHFSNTKLYEKFTDLHSVYKCYDKIEKQIEAHNPDIVVSVHPTMNHVPEKAVRKIAARKNKYIPFFTVVTDFGSGHCTWFQGDVDMMYVASDRISNLAKKRGKVIDDKLVMKGLPIRDDFAVQAEKMGDRTSITGKGYRQVMKAQLGLNPNKKTVLVMGGGEGVGSLSLITEALQKQLQKEGVDATICVVCGRNEKLKNELNERNWNDLSMSGKKSKTKKLRKFARKVLRRKKGSVQQNIETREGKIDVVGLGFVTNMSEYMVAADVLVSKAGPGTIAEAAAVGLPVMITSFLPGQEAGNVDIVLDGGFGAFKQKPNQIGKVVSSWMQDEETLDNMSRKSREVGNPTAASEIVQDILRISMDKINEFES